MERWAAGRSWGEGWNVINTTNRWTGGQEDRTGEIIIPALTGSRALSSVGDIEAVLSYHGSLGSTVLHCAPLGSTVLGCEAQQEKWKNDKHQQPVSRLAFRPESGLLKGNLNIKIYGQVWWRDNNDKLGWPSLDEISNLIFPFWHLHFPTGMECWSGVCSGLMQWGWARVAKLIPNITNKTYQGPGVLIFGSLAAQPISFHQLLPHRRIQKWKCKSAPVWTSGQAADETDDHGYKLYIIMYILPRNHYLSSQLHTIGQISLKTPQNAKCPPKKLPKNPNVA